MNTFQKKQLTDRQLYKISKMRKILTKISLAALFIAVFMIALEAQQQTPLDIALRYVEQNQEKWGLEKTDINNMIVNDQFPSQHNGSTHIYFMQRHQDIRVHNAILGVHIAADGRVVFATNRFIPGLINKINATVPLLTAQQAIIKAAEGMKLPGKAAPTFLSKTERGALVFEDAGISRAPIQVQLMYQPMPGGKVRLAWDLAIQELETPDYWSVRIDALNGALLDKNNWTVYCNFPNGAAHQHDKDCKLDAENTMTFVPVKEALQTQSLLFTDGARYNVFAVPVESPAHGDRQILLNPSDPIASPFGWHDTNGQVGAEYTITRGNNTHTYADTRGNNISNQDEPEGGPNLVFDFAFDPNLEPADYKDAATTQLFYMNNFMHDFAYRYGFDEKAGNFQQNNYQKGGNQGDFILAQAQDGSGNNNANFTTPPDGANGTMQMYLWNRGGSDLFTVIEPEAIAGAYSTGTASYGPAITNVPITGQIVEALDNSGDPKKGCGPYVNAGAVAGKIALVDRGGCFFEEKTVQAQQAGAIALIICNFENNVISMGGVGTITDPNIPTVMLGASDCQVIRQYLDEGVTVTLQVKDSNGPTKLDGSFDNGIVAHEYGHGISNRLTGGPNITSCLSNDEQMGEGWSDFFALAVTAKPGDAPKARGLGSYVWDRDPEGKGFRRFPYSTNMNINTQTYDDIIGAAVPHGVGEVWAGVLWDLFWKFVDVYGWDDNIYTGNGGNNMAIQLVMDGMKLQSCNPGYLDGRDAILAADILNNDGANECLIWEVFARRGLGWSAEQGNAFSSNDGRSAFDRMPECVRELKIAKIATPLINAGDDITYTLTITNHKNESAPGVVVTDELPAGTAYIAGSATGNAGVSIDNGFIRFEIGDMTSGEERTLTYKVSTSAANPSLRIYFDDMEDGFINWSNDFNGIKGTDIWDITDSITYSGTKALFVPNTNAENDQVALMLEPYLVTGVNPVLRFYHNYNTDPGLDGGIVQISTDNGQIWETLNPQFIRNPYYGRIAYNTFATANLQAFTGKSNGFIASYIDLRNYIGREILIRFRFASDAETNNRQDPGVGWAVDDFEFMDMVSYQSEACVTSDQGDQACAMAPAGGTIVESSVLTSSEDLEKTAIDVKLYPNPTRDFVNLAITMREAGDVMISIFSTDGKLLQRQRVGLFKNSQVIPMDVSNLAGGFYFVEIKSGKTITTQKMVIR